MTTRAATAAAGSPRRCWWCARGAGYAGGDDIAVDLRVDEHPDPVTELARLLDLNDLYLTASTPAEQVTITDTLRAEIEEHVRALGFESLDAWAGTENYEMRVGPGGSWIDQQILERLRDAARATRS